MPLPLIQRGELWIVDLGYLGKVRPVLVVSVPFLENERTLCIVVPHTTSVIGTRFEVIVRAHGLKDGAFDVQQTSAVQAAKFVRRIGTLNRSDLELGGASFIENSRILTFVVNLPMQRGPHNGGPKLDFPYFASSSFSHKASALLVLQR
jgi:mRNA interferase MazF